MITFQDLWKKKQNNQKISALTAYDISTAGALDESEIDIILVGDSLGMVVYGYKSTIAVTMHDMKRHTAAVLNGVKNSLVIADMPFASYQISLEDSLKNAVELVQLGAKGVKVEGATPTVIETVKRLKEIGIPVVGHIGFTPQHVNEIGGNIVQGQTVDSARLLVENAILLEGAGIDLLVLEMVPENLAKQITKKLIIPTIGIGAGRYCDGQILVTHDMLGLFTRFKPKFAKRYAHLYEDMKAAFQQYKKDVENGSFPSEEHIF